VKYKIILIVIIVVSLIYVTVYAQQGANWYVDNQASGANNGTSWTDAWQSFSDINWESINPGDVISISGGETEKTYDEPLEIKASGDETNYLTVKIAQDAGHNGTVVITGGEYWGVLFDGAGIPLSTDSICNYVVLSGQLGDNSDPHIRVSDPDDNGICLRGKTSNFIIEYIDVTENGSDDIALGTEGVQEIHGIVTSSLDGVPGAFIGEIRYCMLHGNDADDIHFGAGKLDPYEGFGKLKIHHNEFYNYNDDCIEIALCGVDIYNNVFHDRGEYRSGHPDNIQAYGSYLRVYNNYFYNMIREDNDQGNCQLYFHPTPGSAGMHASNLYAYNNIFYEYKTPPEYGSSAVQMGFGWGISGLSNVLFANNTIVGSWGSALTIQFADLVSDSVDNVIIENNIFTDCGRFPMLESSVGLADTGLSYGPHGSDVDIIFDYNVYHGEKADYFYYGSGDRRHTYEEFKTNTGCQEYDITIDPELNTGYAPTDHSSPVVDAGVDLSEYFDFDKNGFTRPQGVSWDMGVCEYIDSSGIINPNIIYPMILYQNYPNPFYKETTFEYVLSKSSIIEISLFDITGRKVKTYFSGLQSEGEHEIVVDGTNLSSGIYFFKLKDEHFTAVKKCLLIK
jgi:hypothetical protein